MTSFNDTETPAVSLPNRRPAQTSSVGPFAVTVSYHPVTQAPVEVFVTARAKSGTELEQHLYDLGVTASRMMQGKPHAE